MSWLRIDDGFVEHPKVADISDRAFRLHVAALCYCARNLTDGLLTPRSVKVVCALTNATRKHVVELRDVGLWLVSDDAFEIKDYLHYNPDAETTRATKAARREAGKRGADKRWNDGKSHGKTDGKTYSPPHMPRPQSPKELKTNRPVREPNGLGLESLASEGHALRLFAAIRDDHKDDHTRQTILAYAHKLPPAAFENVREELEENRRTIRQEAAWVNSRLAKLVQGRAA